MLGIHRLFVNQSQVERGLAPLDPSKFDQMRFGPSARLASEIVEPDTTDARGRSMASHPSGQSRPRAVA